MNILIIQNEQTIISFMKKAKNFFKNSFNIYLLWDV